MRDLIALAAACALAPPCEAAVFNIVASDADSVTVIDAAATRFDRQEKVFSAWTVTVKRNVAEGEPAQPGYVRTLNEFDCIQRRYRWRTVMVYSRVGSLILQKDNPTPEWVSGYQGRGQDPNVRAVCDDASIGGIAAPTMAALVITLMQKWDAPASSQPPAAGPAPASPPTVKAPAPQRARP